MKLLILTTNIKGVSTPTQIGREQE